MTSFEVEAIAASNGLAGEASPALSIMGSGRCHALLRRRGDGA
jgi:hypothetical protein